MIRRNIGMAAVVVLAVGLMAYAAQAQQERMRRNPNAGFLGVKLGPVSDEVQEELKLESQDGIVVLELIPGSPAEKAGLQKMDVIRKVDGKDITDVEDFVTVMEKSKPDQQVQFSVMREGKMQ